MKKIFFYYESEDDIEWHADVDADFFAQPVLVGTIIEVAIGSALHDFGLPPDKYVVRGYRLDGNGHLHVTLDALP